jgi:hypothetical protein
MQGEIPPPAVDQMPPDAHEVLRVWLADRDTFVSHGFKQDAFSFGRLLARLGHLAALRFAHTESIPITAALTRIQSGFDDEWQSDSKPTDAKSSHVLLQPNEEL